MYARNVVPRLEPFREPYQPRHFIALERPVKRRASKACFHCRARKVKCSVVRTGIPCGNCQRDHAKCAVSHARKRRKQVVAGDTVPEQRDKQVEDGESAAGPYKAMATRLDKFLATAPQSLDFRLSDHVRESTAPALPETETVELISPVSPVLQQPSPSSQASTATKPRSSVSYLRPEQNQPVLVLPRYIRGLRPQINAEDVEYLARKGAFSVPEPSLRNEILRIYVQYIHPYLPMLDLQDLLQPILEDDGTSQVSLLLLQAVMFAGISFVDMSFLRAEGFQTRREARKSYLGKVKLLFNFDIELDPITLVQTLLLMTYWYETPDDRKGPWFWMNTALGFALGIGLNKNSESKDLATKKRRMRRRLWWSCFMRDKLIALSMRKPSGIHDMECDVPMLMMDDFDSQPPASDLLAILGDCSASSDTELSILLAQLCIEKATLCVCISHILDTQYYLSGHRMSPTAEPSMMLFPRRSNADMTDFFDCEQELTQWHGRSRARIPGFNAHTASYNSKVSALHRGVVEMIYLTASSVLHRPKIVPDPVSDPVARKLQHLSRQKIKDAATEITVIAKSLHEVDLVRVLPPAGVTVLLLAAIQHIRDMKSNNIAIREEGLLRFQQTMRALFRLQDIYCSADFALSLIESVLKSLDLDILGKTVTRKAVSRDCSMINPSMSVSTIGSNAMVQHRLNSTNDQSTDESPVSNITDLRGHSIDVQTSIVGGLAGHESDQNDGGEHIFGNDFEEWIDFNMYPDIFLAGDILGIDLGGTALATDMFSDEAFRNIFSF